MNETPTLAQIIKKAIDNRLLDVHTALIAKVESYDAKKQIVDVAPVLKPRIKNKDGDFISENLPILCDVPVLFPRAGGYFLSFPIKPGDFVQLIFNEVSLEEWFNHKASSLPSNQRFTLEGAIAIPGVYPLSKAFTDAPKTNLVLGKENGVQIHIDGEKIRLGSDRANEALAIASKVKEELDRIKSAFNSHTHVSSMGSIKPSDVIMSTTDIATKQVAAS